MDVCDCWFHTTDHSRPRKKSPRGHRVSPVVAGLLSVKRNRSAVRAVVWNPFQANYLLQQPELQPLEQQLLAQQPQWR
jgi:hypothetical protein